MQWMMITGFIAALAWNYQAHGDIWYVGDPAAMIMVFIGLVANYLDHKLDDMASRLPPKP